MQPQALKHLEGPATRVMVVDGSKLVRKLIGDMLLAETPGARIISCGDLAEARAALAADPAILAAHLGAVGSGRTAAG